MTEFAISKHHDGLCEWCDRIDFASLGFHRSQKKQSTIPKVLKHTFTRDILSVKETSLSCNFCNGVFSAIQDGLYVNLERRLEGLRYKQSSVTFQEHIVASRAQSSNEHFQRSRNRLLRLMIIFRVEDPSIDGRVLNVGPEKKFRLSYFYQRASDPRLTVSDCISLGVHLDPNQYHLGRLRPLLVDTSLFRCWKDICSSSHNCGSPKDDSLRTGTLRLIDVEQLCIKIQHRPEKWACLSYVWGNIQLPLLTHETRATFQEPGSLDSETLPPMFQDAIEVTRAMGIRYLWIDCLCILQDDGDDKNHYITAMDSIFKHAFIVLIASSSKNATTGLPGLRPGVRQHMQHILSIRDVPVMRSLDASAKHGQSYVGDTIWTKRAWTFQERFFANRALIFSEEQVYWECQHSFWAEDLCSEFDAVCQLWRSSLQVKRARIPRDLVSKNTFRDSYRELVEGYMSRDLTYDDDGLAAFEGLLREFESVTEEKFLWGMPKAYIADGALAWEAVWEPPRRRTGDVKLSRYSSKAPFPSWAWVGWVGKVGLTPLSRVTENAIKVFTLDEQGRPFALENRLGGSYLDSLGPPWLSKGGESGERSDVIYDDIPEFIRVSPSIASILCFWTESAKINVEKIEENQPRLQHPDTRTRLFAFWRHIPFPSMELGQTIDLIAVARDTKQNVRSWRGGSGGIGALVVTRDNGIAYRVGLVWMNLSEWLTLPTRIRELVFLG